MWKLRSWNKILLRKNTILMSSITCCTYKLNWHGSVLMTYIDLQKRFANAQNKVPLDNNGIFYSQNFYASHVPILRYLEWAAAEAWNENLRICRHFHSYIFIRLTNTSFLRWFNYLSLWVLYVVRFFCLYQCAIFKCFYTSSLTLLNN